MASQQTIPIFTLVYDKGAFFALLFIMAVEILSEEIRQNNIKGIKIQQKEHKICQLADDTTLSLSDIPSLQIALNILYMFYMCSGLKLNYFKTEILVIGKTYKFKKKHSFGVKWVKECVYSLGSWFYEDRK